MYRRSVHLSAAKTVLSLGATIVGQLGDHPAVSAAPGEAANWTDFLRLVHSVHRVESGIEYVSVTEGGIILYHKEMEPVGGAPEVGAPSGRYGQVRIGRTLLEVGNRKVPVITFSLPVTSASGVARSVQVAIRRDAVERREAEAVAVLTAMFNVALLTTAVSGGVSVLVVAWLISREIGRQRQRRQEEHLAFAGALADGIIHDFRNPMSSLKLDVQMLRKEAERGLECRPDRVGELGGRIGRTIDRLDDLFREFLYVSKPGAAAPEPFELGSCVQDCLDLLTSRFERLGIRLKAEMPAEVLMIRGFPSSLKRGIINVLTNAEQASPPGGTVHVKLSKEEGSALLEIADEGPGIPKSHRHRIFDMFVSTRPGGTGLGLSLARAAVEDCRGTIGAHDRPGGGACFVIRIPLDRTPPAAGGAHQQ
jgi:signal transduction histidine kinase